MASQSQTPLPPLATAAAVRELVKLWDRDWATPGSVDVGLDEGLGVLRGRMSEVSLLPSSLRLDLLSATVFSFCSSSDWQSVLLQAVPFITSEGSSVSTQGTELLKRLSGGRAVLFPATFHGDRLVSRSDSTSEPSCVLDVSKCMLPAPARGSAIILLRRADVL